MEFKMIETEEPLDEPVGGCKGVILRGYRSGFFHEGRVEMRMGARILIRKSCPGCKKCSWMLEEINEHLSEDYFDMPDIESGKLYRLEVTDTSTDWESGLVDDYSLGLTRITED